MHNSFAGSVICLWSFDRATVKRLWHILQCSVTIFKINAGQCNSLQSVLSRSFFTCTSKGTPVICQNVIYKPLIILITNAHQCNHFISSYRTQIVYFQFCNVVTADQYTFVYDTNLSCNGEENVVYSDAVRISRPKHVYFL